MKFIRDIIGEKRQADSSISGMPMAIAPASEADALDVSFDSSDAVSARHSDTTYDASTPGLEVHTPIQPQNETDTDLGMSEEVAKFFANSEEANLFLDEYDHTFGDHEDVEDDAFDQPGVAATGADAHPAQPAASGHIADADTSAFVPEEEVAVASSMQSKSDQIDLLLKEELDTVGMVGAHESQKKQTSFPAEPTASAQQFAGDAGPMAVPDAAPRQSAEMPVHPARHAVPSEPTNQANSIPQPAAEPCAVVEVPQPAVGRGVSRHGRVKTRLLGFNTAMETDTDPMSDNAKAVVAPYTSFPVGWLIVVDGPGRGSAFTLFQGVSTIGRGEDQTVRLDFGDNSISRDGHASIAYDDQQKDFFIGHGGKANIVRRNNRPVLSTEELSTGDTITIGETSLRFVSLCCQDFSWDQETMAGRAYANQA